MQSELSLSGTATASITSWAADTDNKVYHCHYHADDQRDIVILDIVNADVATDAAENGNTAATQQTVSVDVDKPTVTISDAVRNSDWGV